MDRLCSEGTTFTNAYTPVPVCVPARCSLIFGQYAHKTGCFENGFDMPEMTRERPTFMSVLAKERCQTHGVGKMHFRPEPRALLGFESRDYVGDGARNPEEDDYLTWLHSKGYDHIVDENGVRFDLLVDPEETRNRAHTLGYLGHTAAMRAALVGYLKEEGYTEPLEGDSWRAYPPPSFPEDPDAGLLFQDPGWAQSRMHIPGYSDDAGTDVRGYSGLVLRAFSDR